MPAGRAGRCAMRWVAGAAPGATLLDMVPTSLRDPTTGRQHVLPCITSHAPCKTAAPAVLGSQVCDKAAQLLGRQPHICNSDCLVIKLECAARSPTELCCHSNKLESSSRTSVACSLCVQGRGNVSGHIIQRCVCLLRFVLNVGTGPGGCCDVTNFMASHSAQVTLWGGLVGGPGMAPLGLILQVFFIQGIFLHVLELCLSG